LLSIYDFTSLARPLPNLQERAAEIASPGGVPIVNENSCLGAGVGCAPFPATIDEPERAAWLPGAVRPIGLLLLTMWMVFLSQRRQEAQLQRGVRKLTPSLECAMHGHDQGGRGGMITKLRRREAGQRRWRACRHCDWKASQTGSPPWDGRESWNPTSRSPLSYGNNQLAENHGYEHCPHPVSHERTKLLRAPNARREAWPFSLRAVERKRCADYRCAI